MAGRGRPAGFIMDDSHRTKIANSKILNRLIDFAEGNIELDSGRIKAIEILLRKVLPDLAAVQVSGDPDKPLSVQHGIAPAAQILLSKIEAIAERSAETRSAAE